MGQAKSTLWGRRPSWASRWRAHFTTAKGGDLSSTAQDCQQSGSAEFSNGRFESLLLAFGRNPIGCASKRWQPKVAHPPSPFEVLPRELILEITQHLSLSSALSVSCTCRKLRHTVEARVEDLDSLIDMKSILEDPQESEDERRVVMERLAFLRMLERDAQLSASKAVCRE